MAAGEVRSRGLELDVAGRLTANWRLNASLVFNDVEITRDNTLEVGGRLLNVPKVNGSVLAVYENALANGQRYGVGGGVTYGQAPGPSPHRPRPMQAPPRLTCPATPRPSCWPTGG